jgi:DNA-binding Lrp family transcriptional regulator
MNKIDGIKLDKVDRRILFELDKNCRTPSKKLAKIVHKSRQTVEYRVNNLIKNGIIASFQVSINPHKMGYILYKVYLRLKNIPYEKEKLLKYLKSSSIVYWLGECSGTWDLIFGVFAKNNYEFFEFKNDFISKFGESIIESYGEPLIDVKQYTKTYLLNSLDYKSESVMFGGEIFHNTLDNLDYSILEEVANNARISIVDLSSKTKGSVPTILVRLKKLEKLGIIIQYRVGIDLNKLNLELYKCIIKLERYTKDDEQKLLQYVSVIPNIQYFIRNIWQLELELVVRNYQEYYKIIEELKGQFPEVIRNVDSVLMISDEWTPGFRNLLNK